MKILVTGGAGFIGSHICDALILEGHDVTSLDSLEAGVDFTPRPRCQNVARSLERLGRPLAERFDCVVHCAARADIASNWADPTERYKLWVSNILGTAMLLEYGQPCHVVFLSTCAVYGDFPGFESERCIATSPYAASKLAGEAIIQAYAYRHRTGWHALRLAGVVGARYHHGHIADFVEKARQGRVQALSDGLSPKPYVHVSDVCSAVKMAVMGKLSEGIYNVVGASWSARDTAALMGIDVEWGANHAGWIGDPLGFPSAEKLQIYGWRAQHLVSDGVEEALEHLGWNVK